MIQLHLARLTINKEGEREGGREGETILKVNICAVLAL
jgi:hypothetical protein